MRRRMGILLFAALVMLAACSKNDTISASGTQRIQELGDEFVAELDDIFIPIREQNDRLLETDAVVMIDEKTHNISWLYSFYEDYKVGDTTTMTAVIKSKNFVVIRVVFEGNTGYYFRYEFDQFNEKDIVVSSQLLDSIEIQKDDTLNKVELTLLKNKMSPMVFSFKNIVESDSDAIQKV